MLKTQELAGIDLVSDGELPRFDVSHPETNGMIDYFIRPMGGISTTLTREDLARFAAEQRMRFRAQPAGVVDGPLTGGKHSICRGTGNAFEASPAPTQCSPSPRRTCWPERGSTGITATSVI
ncbi:MAG: hypothetical protein CM1200mP34_0590 [Verrucomicrobiales bacterium]|nr:MAG: hypothetical protein CM1200mP34_0590 [Verrucomicrobiales bacterium]